MEELFQARYSTAPLGMVRLWRAVAKGRKFAYPNMAVYKVFITHSIEVQEWIRRGEVVVVP